MFYEVLENEGRIELKKEFRDYVCSLELGKIRDAFLKNDYINDIVVDMSRTEWADPLPLLALGCMLSFFNENGKQIYILLGDTKEENDEHKRFLKFFLSQGFIDAYSKFVKFTWCSIEYDAEHIKKLKAELVEIDSSTYYSNADCIFAKFINTRDYYDQREKKLHIEELHIKVDELVDEARDRLIDSAYGGDPLSRDRLLQKIRKIFFEIISNSIEHAYIQPHNGEFAGGYVGLYARLRERKPDDDRGAKQWEELIGNENKIKNCPALKAYGPNPLSSWIEIFICDIGVGLLSNIDKWRINDNNAEETKRLEKLKKDIADGKTIDILRTIANLLFVKPVTSIVNRKGRSSATGLLLLGVMLKHDSDFTRIYTNGAWVGNRHPWNRSLSNHGVCNVTRGGDTEREKCSPGTWYSFSLQPGILLEYPKSWVVPTEGVRDRLINALALPQLADVELNNIEFIDRRMDPHCSLPKESNNNKEYFVQNNISTVVLRPPRSLQKNQLLAWISRLVFPSDGMYCDKSYCFILADLTPFQAITYSEIIPHMSFPSNSLLDIYLVTEDWSVCCITILPESKKSEVYPVSCIEKAKTFTESPRTSYSISIIDILLLLRKADSEIFWRSQNNKNGLPEEMYIYDTVKWSSAHDYKNEFLIKGYLNLPQALTDEKRYQACHRALRRCMNLFPDYDVFPSDDLIKSIVIDSDRGRYKKQNKKLNAPRKKLVIGSICVTSSTVDRILKRADMPEGSLSLYIFIHPDSKIDPNKPQLAVLDWIPPKAKKRINKECRYQRIPEAPYIELINEKANLFPRFRRPSANSTELTGSLYGRTPNQTYDDFHTLNILKMGHWVYENTHNLLTINLGRAIELSDLDNGSLIIWLENKIRSICLDTNGMWKQGCIVLYPSHTITDQMVSIIKERMSIEKITLNNQLCFFPLKFLKPTNTISPHSISQLSYNYLKDKITKIKESKQQVHIVILDDGILSGKTLRELQQLTIALGTDIYETIVLLDRSGLPIHLDYFDKFLKRNHRFWRWDIPTLGFKRRCLICTALNNAKSLQKMLSSESMRRRINELITFWRATNVINGWETNGLNPISLGKDIEVDSHSFGIYPGQTEPLVHTVRHKTSTSLAAALVEITFLTGNIKYILKKARKVQETYNPEAGIEILASQFLFFFDELGYWAKVDLIYDLIKYLWMCTVDSEFTALASLCITLIDDEIISEIWPRFYKNIFCCQEVQTIDARITTKFLYQRYSESNNSKTGIINTNFENLGKLERYNILIILWDENFRKNIARIFGIIGDSHQEFHGIGLQKCISEADRIKNTQKNDPVIISHRIKDAKILLEDLKQSLENIVRDPIENNLINKKIIDKIKVIINDPIISEDIKNTDYIPKAQLWFNNLSNEFSEEKPDSISSLLRTQYVFRTKAEQKISTFLNELLIIKEFKKTWPGYILERNNEGKSINKRWQDKTLEPKIMSANDDDCWQNDLTIYCDNYIKQCITEILANSVHTSIDIPNPWRLRRDNRTDVHATMWWKITCEDEYIRIDFANACNIDHFNLKPTEAFSGLERVNGEVKCYVIQKSFDNVTSHNSYNDSINLEYFTGIPDNQRLAVTSIRIPKMKAIRKGE